jgi:opacity protein-like surface antigen
MKKILLILTVFILMTGMAQSQDKPSSLGYTPSSYYTLSWNTTFTIGGFKDWVGNASPAGFDIGGRYFIKGGLAAGFNFAWQRVSQIYDFETFYGENGQAITATNYRFTWMTPFQAVIAYHLMPEKMFSPYVGLGIGGDYMEHHILVQDKDIYKTRWDFSLTPEVGALVRFGNFSQWGALVAFNYKWTTNQIEFGKNFDTGNLSMLNLKVGLAMIIR